MTVAVAACGWLVALACVAAIAALRRRLERVADAEHELRGALTAFGLALTGAGRDPAASRLTAALECELERARVALADLAGGSPAPPAKHARRPPAGPALERLVRSTAAAWAPAVGARGIEVDWRAGAVGSVAPAGRVAQALGNLVSNAAEHGDGAVSVSAVRAGRDVRVEVANGAGGRVPAAPPGGRGRGLRIAARAARAAGGRVAVGATPDRVVATLELPVER